MLDYGTQANTRQEVIEASPQSCGVQSTDSYLAVPHYSVVKTIENKVNKEIKSGYLSGFKVVSNEQHLNGSSKQMFGKMTLEHESMKDDTNGGNALRFCIGYRNSYDKSLPLQLVFGSVVVVCSNMMFSGETFAMRKHTKGKDEGSKEGEAKFYQDFKLKLDEGLQKGLEIHKANHETRDTWKQTYLKDEAVLAEILGSLAFGMNGCENFFNKNYSMNNQQLTILKNEIADPAHSEFERDEISRKFSVWAVYNCVTEALKKSRPEIVTSQYLAAHNFIDFFVNMNPDSFINQADIDELNLEIQAKALKIDADEITR